MPLFESLLGPADSSVRNFASNALSDLGYGLSRGTDFGQALGYATQRTQDLQPQRDAYATAQKADKQRLDQINQTVKYLQSNPAFADLVPIAQAGEGATALAEAFKRSAPGYGEQTVAPGSTVLGPDNKPVFTAPDRAANAADPSDVATYKFYSQQETAAGRTPKSFDDWTAGTKPGIKGSLGQPLPFLDPKTQQLHPIQQFTDGSRIDLSTGSPPDPSLTYAPYDLSAQKAGGASDANNAATARNLLPGAEQAYAVTKRAIAQLTSDPSVMEGQKENFSNFPFTPIPEQMLPVTPKSNRANFQNVISQLSGDAFLNIRQALKGAGSVTDFEGQKGEQAISRMKDAAERGDNKAFEQAVQDYNTALDTGLELLRKQAGGGYAAGNVPGLPSQGSGDPELDKALAQYGQ